MEQLYEYLKYTNYVSINKQTNIQRKILDSLFNIYQFSSNLAFDMKRKSVSPPFVPLLPPNIVFCSLAFSDKYDFVGFGLQGQHLNICVFSTSLLVHTYTELTHRKLSLHI